MKIVYPALGLAGETGEVIEHVKKMYRDSSRVLDAERRAKLIKEIGDVLWYIAVLTEDLGIPLSEVAETNIAKLKSRQERGVLHGAGSDR